MYIDLKRPIEMPASIHTHIRTCIHTYIHRYEMYLHFTRKTAPIYTDQGNKSPD